jgi:hypothetical protein
MTTSIVFNELSCNDISNATFRNGITLSDPVTDQERYTYYPQLVDPTEPQTSLQRLRVLKDRNTGDQVVTPVIEGRSNGDQVPYGGLNPTYKEYKIRRKAEVLKSKNEYRTSTNKKYAYASKFGKVSNSRIKALRASQNCGLNNFKFAQKPAINSGVHGDNTILYLNPNVTFFPNL